MAKTILEKTITGFKWTSTSTVISSIAKFLQIVILTRYLDKNDFGLVAIALLIISFTDIFFRYGNIFSCDVSEKYYKKRV
ncbi:oligosaccharide flippase family protein [Bacteroides fragilis]